MKEKVVELLMVIMAEMRDKAISEIDIGDLRNRGYTQSEISQAFSWLYENVQNVQGGKEVAKRSPGSRRMLHDAEKLVMSTESQGYLIQMREIGLLDDRDMEAVIERAMASGLEKLTPEELREIVASVLFSRRGRGRDSFPPALDSGDTIH